MTIGTLELRAPRFSVVVRDRDAQQAKIIASGLARLTGRLLNVSGWTGQTRLTIDYGREVLRSSLNIGTGEMVVSQFMVRRINNPNEADIDEAQAAFVIGHEIAHFHQFYGIQGFPNEVLRNIGWYRRWLEFRADRSAANCLLQLGYRDPVSALERSLRPIEDLRNWPAKTHPTVGQRRVRMEKYLKKLTLVAPRYAGEKFAELSQPDPLTIDAPPHSRPTPLSSH
jgi:hypothetical protein